MINGFMWKSKSEIRLSVLTIVRPPICSRNPAVTNELNNIIKLNLEQMFPTPFIRKISPSDQTEERSVVLESLTNITSVYKPFQPVL